MLSCGAMRARLLSGLLFGLLGGCAPAPADDTAPVTDPTRWAAADGETEARVPLTPAELEEGLAEVIAYLHRLDPLTQHEAWTEVFRGNAEADGCPDLGLHNGQDYWNDDCTTAAGAQFNGWMLNFRQGGWDEGTVHVNQYNWLSGHAFVAPPDGTLLQSFGDVELLLGEDAAGWAIYSGFVYGDFSWDDPAAVGTWLQEDESNETYFRYEDHGSWQSASIDAAITYFEGPVLAARLEALTLDDAPDSCAAEPVGRVRLRDTTGFWVNLDFGDDCDGCTEATLDGASLGTVCADFSPLVDWQEWPWVP